MTKHILLRLRPLGLGLGFMLGACGGPIIGGGQGEVAEINNDWTGNEIKIDAFSGR